jgi:photosystem II stability/assembly factor-like uncharacterized protein
MKITCSAVAAVGLAALAVTAAAPAGADSQSRHQRGSRAVAAVTAACHRKASPKPTYVAAHSLDAVQFVSATTGWVAGANRVLATTDGGAHWSLQRSAPRADYSEVDAIDTAHAWVVGRHQLIATTNGGATWRSLPEPCPVISSVHFYSPSAGVAVAGGKLLQTSDGGRKWRAMKAPRAVQSVCFTSSQNGWLGAHGRIYRTLSGGRIWAKVVAGPKPYRARFAPFAAVQCAGPDAGWGELIGPGVASNQQAHIGYYLSDSGPRAIFAEQYFSHPGVTVHRESPGAYYAAFSAVDPADAVFIDTCAPCNKGTSPVGIAERDGNSFLRPGRVGHLEFATGAAFASTSDGWVVGNVTHYRKRTATWKVVHTTDGGKNWTTQYVE